MHKKIFSRKKKKTLLGIIFRLKNSSNKRKNISPENEFLQVSTQVLKKDFVVKPHLHVLRKKISKLVQEVWIVIRGEVEIKIYDLDRGVLKKTKLKSGDMYILFRGGHEMKVIKNNTLFYEIKNGPYNPKIKDIKYIN